MATKKASALCSLLGIKHPIIQAPMLGVSSAAMAIAASNTGILGSIAAGGFSQEQLLNEVKLVKAGTSKPFAVNLFVYDYPSPISNVSYSQSIMNLQRLCATHQIPFKAPDSYDLLPYHPYNELLEVIITERVPIVSFTFGVLKDEEIDLLQQHKILIIGTATTAEEVRLLDKKGIDIICLQSGDAGGHRGSFLPYTVPPMLSLQTLLETALEVTDRPLVAAGGIWNKKTMEEALAMGASGVQLGSLFLASNESIAAPSYKKAVQHLHPEDLVLTRSFSGRWARGIANTLTKTIDKSTLEIPPYPIQNGLTTPIRNWAKQHDNPEFIALWAGTHADQAKSLPTAEIIHQFLTENDG